MTKTRLLTFTACICTVFALLFSSVHGEYLTDAGKILKKYDVSLDGAISVSDVTATLNHLATSAAEKNDPFFDFSGEGVTSIGDVTLLLNYLANNCGHKRQILPAKEPTCTEDGHTEGAICALCSLPLMTQTTFKASGHQYEGDRCTLCKQADAKAYLEKMTLHEKICQLFILRPEELGNGQSATALNSALENGLSAYPVGGFILFANNISTPDQLTDFTSDMQSSSKIPLFMAVDEEGGRVARIARKSSFPEKNIGTALSIGQTGDPQNAYNAYSTVGSYLKKYGFNLDFAPVADVFTNPKNTVIGDRAFGTTPDLVSKMLSAALQGMESTKVIGCTKHFPGHGDTAADSHTGFVQVTKSWEELKDCEILPFKAAIDEGVSMIMTAHITTPNVTNDGLPASLSYEMITGKLRNELGFQGVVITDALEMGAIANHYGAGEACVMALEAGCDILLLPADFSSGYEAISAALSEGRLSEQRLNESVLRILQLKAEYGIL